MKTSPIAQATEHIKTLRGFIGRSQLAAIGDACRREEKEFFLDKLAELAGIVSKMPQTYDEGSRSAGATVWLHYFAGGQAHFYITEKDKGAATDTPEEFQSQAWGLADLFNDGGECGYISLPEILRAGAELDLHWTPRPLDVVRAEREFEREPVAILTARKPDRALTFKSELAALLASIEEKANKQFTYNEERNIPQGIIAVQDSIRVAINHGVISALSARHRWAHDSTIELAADLLEDVNAHAEAAQLRASLHREPATA